MTQLCGVWDLDDDCSEIPDGTPQELIDKWQAVSSRLLWAASGRRYGLCEVTIRPCLRRCFNEAWWGSYGYTYPFLAFPFGDGSWFNVSACGCLGDCSCTELCEIVLPGPVASIDEVGIDGEAVDPSTYRLDLVGGEYRLLRTDDSCFPTCQDIKADVGDPGSFWVTYEQGIPLDDLAIAANTELTSELIKACDESCKTCRLPKNATVVVRRGVTIQMDLAKAWLQALPIVSAFLQAVNPQGLTSSPDVFSPDVPRFRETVVPFTS